MPVVAVTSADLTFHIYKRKERSWTRRSLMALVAQIEKSTLEYSVPFYCSEMFYAFRIFQFYITFYFKLKLAFDYSIFKETMLLVQE